MPISGTIQSSSRLSSSLETLSRLVGANLSDWPYLLLARFAGDNAAPLPATLPVDIGNLAVTDTESKLSQSGGNLVCAGQKTVPGWGDPAVISSTSLARVTGRALLWDYTRTGGTSAWEQAGWTASATPPVAQGGLAGHGFIANQGSGVFRAITNSTEVDTSVTLVTGTVFKLAVVLRPTGAFYLIGQAGSPYTLVWVGAAVSTASLYVTLENYQAASTYDNLRVTDLPAPWNSAYGIATQRLVSPSLNATFTHAADCVLEFSFTYLTANPHVEVGVRYLNANNYWRVYTGAVGELFLIQKEGGVSTNRIATAGGVLVDGSAYRVVVTLTGTVYTLYVNDVSKGTYTDTNNFQTTLAGGVVSVLDTSITEVIAWPRTLSLPSGV